MNTNSSPAFGPAIAGLGLPLRDARNCPGARADALTRASRDVGARPRRRRGAGEARSAPLRPSRAEELHVRATDAIPPDLSGDVRIVKAGKIRIGRKPPKLAPFVVKEFRLGPRTGWSAVDVDAFDARFDATFGFHVEHASQSLSFQLAREDLPDAPVVTARCVGLCDGVEEPLSRERRSRVACAAEKYDLLRVPRRAGRRAVSSLPRGRPAVEPLQPPLSVPRRARAREGPLRGHLDERHEPRPPRDEGPDDHRHGLLDRWPRAVAAVERLLPGRVLMACSVPAAEESLFVAVGTALLVQDFESGAFPH